MFEKATPGCPFLGRTSFYVLKVDFRYVAVRKSIISSVYWLLNNLAASPQYFS